MEVSTQLPLSELILNMEESATIKMAQDARDLAAQGHEVISLSLGEPDFDTPQHIKEAAKEALDMGYTKYTPVPGLVELREAIVEKFKRDNDLDFDVSQIMVSNGAKQCIANIAMALLNPGDDAVVFTPYWVSYGAIIKMAGANVIEVSAGIEQDFKVSPEQLREALTPKTKFVLFSSPCNPTGSVYTRQELEALAEVLSSREEVLIVSDEIYEYINFTPAHASIGTIPGLRDRTITVNGFSKGFAMTGWRLGYMGGPKWLIQACSKIQGQFTSGASSFGQKAAVTALRGTMAPTAAMRDAFIDRRNLVIDSLSAIDGFKVNRPMGAFYIFPDVSAYFGKRNGDLVINNADDMASYLLHNAHVATVSGSAFGAPDCLRLSYAASESSLVEACKRIAKACAELV